MNDLDIFLDQYNEIVSLSFDIIFNLEHQIMVVPTDYGTILFEDRYLNNYLSIEVYNNHLEVIYIKEMDIKQVTKIIIIDDLVKNASNLLNSFHKGGYNGK